VYCSRFPPSSGCDPLRQSLSPESRQPSGISAIIPAAPTLARFPRRWEKPAWVGRGHFTVFLAGWIEFAVLNVALNLKRFILSQLAIEQGVAESSREVIAFASMPEDELQALMGNLNPNGANFCTTPSLPFGIHIGTLLDRERVFYNPSASPSIFTPKFTPKCDQNSPKILQKTPTQK
jgi:hypothetical protein